MALNILFGDAQPRVSFGLRFLFEQQLGWSVAGEADDAQALLDAVHLRCPDLVLLDWELPGIPAIDQLAQIRTQRPRLGIVLMSGKIELRSITLLAGADIHTYQANPPGKLLEQIQAYIVGKLDI